MDDTIKAASPMLGAKYALTEAQHLAKRGDARKPTPEAIEELADRILLAMPGAIWLMGRGSGDDEDLLNRAARLVKRADEKAEAILLDRADDEPVDPDPPEPDGNVMVDVPQPFTVGIDGVESHRIRGGKLPEGVERLVATFTVTVGPMPSDGTYSLCWITVGRGKWHGALIAAANLVVKSGKARLKIAASEKGASRGGELHSATAPGRWTIRDGHVLDVEIHVNDADRLATVSAVITRRHGVRVDAADLVFGADPVPLAAGQPLYFNAGHTEAGTKGDSPEVVSHGWTWSDVRVVALP